MGNQAESPDRLFQPGFPRFFWNRGEPIPYEIKLDTGEVRIATIDSSHQYRAEGLCWDVLGMGLLKGHRIVGWREVEGS